MTVGDLHAYHGPVEAVRGVTLSVAEGEFAVVIGPNGAGKSTLLAALAGLLPSRTGRVHLLGRELPPGRPDLAVARGMALVTEEREIFTPLSVEENLLLGAYLRGGRGPSVRADLARVYALFPDLAARRRMPAGNLSGGQQQMLVIGRALMARPRLLLLDEPSLGLAPLVVAEIFATIQNLRAEGLTVVLVEQNAKLALSFADRAYVLEGGRVVLSGTGPGLLGDERVRHAYLGVGAAAPAGA